ALASCRAATTPPASVAPTPATPPASSAASVPTAAPTPGSPAATSKVTVGWVPTAALAPLYVAIERGYFAEQAIEPELIVTQNSSQMVASLGTDEMNVAITAMAAGLMNALGRGIAVKVLSPVGTQPRQGPASNQLVVRQ